MQTNQFPKIVQLLNEKKLYHNGLITHQFALDEVQEAFNFVEAHPEQVRKAIIVFD